VSPVKELREETNDDQPTRRPHAGALLFDHVSLHDVASLFG
jgi:hypothetical protein